ncbi:helicase-exonuclease AddAB subunit AddA [Anaerotalea alkaliphila]|uniref:ATP-dependent helicase/nuclease subunit A n=1 Tax=Anaerotalea alkaliphila TaxID=2662126 RepID=A0A7X5HU16_9FIRM|nr:helicase-exonuclease AddAB subunit AddA [Anaerotalea alkaliphila]NDL66550.1 helicase-exonuclease AddAB subunit AddA [Anaerotalea alkaliphila]
MGNMQFTEEQESVICTRGRNMLVSAAAGSGKTAVLVERIIRRVLDQENPLEIDRLLVVTFTHAAASEMRERIGEALERAMESPEGGRFLNRQMTLLPTADIMTIHAFCLKVLRTYYDRIGLDPGFRVGDETELALLRHQVMEEVLEAKYEEGDPGFLRLVESHASGKTDERLEEMVEEAYAFAMSNPWPVEWLRSCLEKTDVRDLQTYRRTEYYRIMRKEVGRILQEAREHMQAAAEIASMDQGPGKYRETIRVYLEHVDGLERAVEEEDGQAHVRAAFPSQRLSTASKGVDPELREEAKREIEAARELLKPLQATWFNGDDNRKLAHLGFQHDIMEVFVELVESFLEAYAQEKVRRNLIDFNDIEHHALEILLPLGEDGTRIPSQAARDLRKQYVEVLVDEYQDSNEVQEAILSCVSREGDGEPNRFMVGDVKQSIYKFRLAKPEIFIQKYHAYGYGHGTHMKVDLQKNFRSRREVLEGVNAVFTRIMGPELGDVAYDEKARLNPGASYAPGPGYLPAVMLVDRKEMEEGEQDLKTPQLEARAVGLKIQELVRMDPPFQVYDKQLDGLRPLRYKDVTVLMRSPAGWTDVFLEEFKSLDIPVHAQGATGYFESVEIRIMVSLLQVLDNPRQEIPLYAVLRSPVVGLSGNELASIRGGGEGMELMDALEVFASREDLDSGNGLEAKVSRFLDLHKELREQAGTLPVHELLLKAYDLTGYYAYASLMPGGKQRQANLDLLVDKSLAYGKTGSQGIFAFLRYLEHIKKFSIEMGEASLFMEDDDLVRIMSIHKSKGLEFPVVFVAGLGKKFNKMDLNKSLVLHQELGFGVDYVDLDRRYRLETLAKTAIRQVAQRELLSEEMRILYVAMTRAKEKLFLCGTVTDLEKKRETWSRVPTGGPVPFGRLWGAGSLLDWVMLALEDGGASGWEVAVVPPQDLQEAPILAREAYLEDMGEWLEGPVDPEALAELSAVLDWSYGHEVETKVPVSTTVSALKRALPAEDRQGTEAESRDLEPGGTEPAFIRQARESAGHLGGAALGTAYHKVLRHLDFGPDRTSGRLEAYLAELEGRGVLTPLERRHIRVRELERFLGTSLAARMGEAAAKGMLERERPFVVGIPGRELSKAYDTEETVMLQGVIDAYFEEEGGYVLVDYKTDKVAPREEGTLRERYNSQMGHYRRALEQLGGKKVKEAYIYSFPLGKALTIEGEDV